MSSLIIKKVWYISLKKKQQTKHNNKKHIIIIKKPPSLSFRLRDRWVSSLAGMRGNSIWGFLCGIRRIFLLILTFILALESFSLLSLATILVGVFWNFQGSRRDLVRLWLHRYLSGLPKVKGVRT